MESATPASHHSAARERKDFPHTPKLPDAATEVEGMGMVVGVSQGSTGQLWRRDLEDEGVHERGVQGLACLASHGHISL